MSVYFVGVLRVDVIKSINEKKAVLIGSFANDVKVSKSLVTTGIEQALPDANLSENIGKYFQIDQVKWVLMQDENNLIYLMLCSDQASVDFCISSLHDLKSQFCAKAMLIDDQRVRNATPGTFDKSCENIFRSICQNVSSSHIGVGQFNPLTSTAIPIRESLKSALANTVYTDTEPVPIGEGGGAPIESFLITTFDTNKPRTCWSCSRFQMFLIIVAAIVIVLLIAVPTAVTISKNSASESSSSKRGKNSTLPDPTYAPTFLPTPLPGAPTFVPTSKSTSKPSFKPSSQSTLPPTTKTPSNSPVGAPTACPSHNPTVTPVNSPSTNPSQLPTSAPISNPTPLPTSKPNPSPTPSPVSSPTFLPSAAPTFNPTPKPSSLPSPKPSLRPTSKPSPIPTPSPVSTGEPTTMTGITSAHNTVRSNVVPAASPALGSDVWVASVAVDAQAWADGCSYKHGGTGWGTLYGQNIYAAAGFYPTVDQVVNSWSSEDQYYDYATNTCDSNEVCGHYTQIVWRSSTNLGCGYKECSTNSPFGSSFPVWQYWVCNYNPPGNYVGQRPY